jgi:predicted solute-binding protein
MYVNNFTREYGETGREAIRLFLRTAHERGYIDKESPVQFLE